MEAMTVMGMAASQARFLGLTARKSNVEYQGQQINQQRTALSNESANLYNQMMELDVPTPPATSDYYKTSYVLENSSGSYSADDYQIANLTKTYNAENEYTVTLSAKREYTQAQNPSYRLSSTKSEDVTGVNSEGVSTTHKVYTMTLLDKAANLSTNITYDESDTDAYTGSNNSLKIKQNQIYLAQKDKGLSGYDQCCTDPNETYYFYQATDGKNYFLTQSQLDELKDPSSVAEDKNLFNLSTIYTYTKSETTQVTATLEKSSSGRYSTIQIKDDENYPNDLKGKTFSLNTVQEMDEDAYKDAYNDYEYNKTLYEKTISDINAQTEIIQSEDQQLELRLQQLSTEQNAISTEMESVKNVISKNVESTFKTFA